MVDQIPGPYLQDNHMWLWFYIILYFWKVRMFLVLVRLFLFKFGHCCLLLWTLWSSAVVIYTFEFGNLWFSAVFWLSLLFSILFSSSAFSSSLPFLPLSLSCRFPPLLFPPVLLSFLPIHFPSLLFPFPFPFLSLSISPLPSSLLFFPFLFPLSMKPCCCYCGGSVIHRFSSYIYFCIHYRVTSTVVLALQISIYWYVQEPIRIVIQRCTSLLITF